MIDEKRLKHFFDVDDVSRTLASFAASKRRGKLFEGSMYYSTINRLAAIEQMTRWQLSIRCGRAADHKFFRVTFQTSEGLEFTTAWLHESVVKTLAYRLSYSGGEEEWKRGPEGLIELVERYAHEEAEKYFATRLNWPETRKLAKLVKEDA